MSLSEESGNRSILPEFLSEAHSSKLHQHAPPSVIEGVPQEVRQRAYPEVADEMNQIVILPLCDLVNVTHCKQSVCQALSKT